MSDLEPLTNIELSSPIVQDPGVTRVLHRHGDPADVMELADVARTSCSFVVLDGQTEVFENTIRHFAADVSPAAVDPAEPQIRRELLVVVDGDRTMLRSSLRTGLSGTGVTWQMCDKVLGGRASVMAEAVEYAANEFLIMSIGVGSDLDRITSLLGHMWIEGADVGVLGPAGAQAEVRQTAVRNAEVDQSDDAAHLLTQWLGLAGSAPEGSLVMMRRWVARWLFNEISRSIDPAEELADRARLLGLAIVYLT